MAIATGQWARSIYFIALNEQFDIFNKYPSRLQKLFEKITFFRLKSDIKMFIARPG